LFTAGAVSGAIGKTITAPLDRVKLLLQTSGGLQQGAVKQAVRKGGVWQALVAIGRTEGIKGYWKGNLPQVGHAGTYFALAGHAFSLPTSKPTLHCTANPNSKTCRLLCISVALRIAHVCILICLFNRLSLLGNVALLMNADLEGCAIQCHAAVFVWGPQEAISEWERRAQHFIQTCSWGPGWHGGHPGKQSLQMLLGTSPAADAHWLMHMAAVF